MKVKMITKNECHIYIGGNVFLQSYDTVVAKKGYSGIVLYKYWDYSRTTMRQVNSFLSECFGKRITKKDIIELEKQGKISILDTPCGLTD